MNKKILSGCVDPDFRGFVFNSLNDETLNLILIIINL